MTRTRKRSVGIYAFIIILISLAGYFYWQSRRVIVQKDVASDYQKVDLVINNKEISVYVADTQEKQRLGLSIFQEISDSEGMLFIYNEAGKPGFWMKDMKFDIDIVWIRDKKVVGIAPEISHYNQNTKYYPEENVDAVLEVNSGFCEMNNIEVGDQVSN